MFSHATCISNDTICVCETTSHHCYQRDRLAVANMHDLFEKSAVSKESIQSGRSQWTRP
jgi:hypothetical protein